MWTQSERLLINRWWWTPVLERPGADAFLDRLPDDALRAGDFPNDVALMFGLNEREGSACKPQLQVSFWKAD